MSNSSVNKTIKINPDLFKVSSMRKTKKEKPVKTPNLNLVNPNVIKKKLLDKIKERKNKDNPPAIHIKTELGSSRKKEDISTFTDEFTDSIQYLTTLSKKNKEEAGIQKKREMLENKTVKRPPQFTQPNPVIQSNHFAQSNQFAQPSQFTQQVSLTLPEELMPQVHHEPPHYATEVMQLRPSQIAPQPPWGCLKNGSKPTYRSWTRKQREPMEQPTLKVLEPVRTSAINEREKKLEMLKQKIKQQKQQEQMEQQMKENLLCQTATATLPLPIQQLTNESNIIIPGAPILDASLEQAGAFEVEPEEFSLDDALMEGPVKKITKKTTLKKYTLGKSKTQKKVGILLKNKATQNEILLAQKDLRRKPILDVRTHLQEHHLIRHGSSIPNDCARAIYESAYLSGDVTNKNRDTILHNLMNESK
jgi:hypothetical protein